MNDKAKTKELLIAELTGLRSRLAEYEHTETALRDSEENLRSILDSVRDAVITVDTGCRIMWMNAAAERITGWKREDAAGEKLCNVFISIKYLTGKQGGDRLDEVLLTGKMRELYNHTILVSKDNKKYQVSNSSVPIRNESGEIVKMVLVFRDIAEKLKVFQESLKTVKLKSTGILAGGIAHDFNNMFTGLYGSIELAKSFLSADHKAYIYLESADRSMEAAVKLTRQLLTFAKGGDPVKEHISIGGFISETAEFSLRGSSVKLVTEIAGDLLPVEADKDQLGQAVTNLVINGQQAMPAGGTLRITASNIEVSGCKEIKITIEDRGTGIPAEDLVNIFDPYFSTWKKGHGLGLTTAHSIIIKHDGRITVDSRLGHGTVFTIFLPASEKILSDEIPPDTEIFNPDSIRILVLDDEEMVRDVIGSMLEIQGYSVSFAAEGSEAVEKYSASYTENTPFDIVITDLTIPGGMGGLIAAREILKINPAAKIIVSSGYTDDPVLANYREHGFTGIVEKPYRYTTLLEMIYKVLRVKISSKTA